MANLVEQIYDALLSTTSTALGAGWVQMRFVREPEKNDKRTIAQAYGVLPLDGTSSEGVTRVYTMDHNFEIVLSKSYVERNDESDVVDAELELYNKADSIFTQSVLTKLGLSSIVLNVFDQRVSAPEKLATQQAVLVRLGLTVKYRNTLTL